MYTIYQLQTGVLVIFKQSVVTEMVPFLREEQYNDITDDKKRILTIAIGNVLKWKDMVQISTQILQHPKHQTTKLMYWV